MQLITTFAWSYPRQSAVLLAASLCAGLAEGASLNALLPLLSFGITPTIGVLLVLVVSGVAL